MEIEINSTIRFILMICSELFLFWLGYRAGKRGFFDDLIELFKK